MTGADQATSGEQSTLAAFEHERGRLFGIAYRMLGSVAEAEDLVQDAYVRWHAVEYETVANPAAFLVRLVTRLCIDALKSARSRRVDYVGPWLPEPLLADRGEYSNPVIMQELADDLSTAFLVLLERLTPVERAVFLLHESFAFSYAEIADVIGKSEANCRQIARRARQHVDGGDYRAPADPDEHDRLLTHFLRATSQGDVEGMIALLAHDAVLYADGGGKAQAARQPLFGANNVARFVLGLNNKFAGRMAVNTATINSRTGLLVYVDGRLENVITLLIADGKIHRMFLVVNPDKLPHDGGSALAP